MLPVIDTHTHLDFPDFDADRPDVISRAQAAGVRQMLLIGTRPSTLDRNLSLCEAHPCLRPVLGYHPGNVDEVEEKDLSRLESLCLTHPVAALGECGLDYHRPPAAAPDETPTDYESRKLAWKEKQKKILRAQLDMAVRLGLNVVIHQRDAWEDTVTLLRDYTGRLRAVFHCFGGTPEQMTTIRNLGHLVSFTGIVTFKNALTTQACAASVDPTGYMVETDCPYLAPVPLRGKRCEPGYTREIVRCLAKLRGASEDTVARETNENAGNFFRL